MTLLLLLCVAIGEVTCLTIDYRHHADALGCAELAHVAIGSVSYRTARKEVLRGKLNQSVDVAVERPYDGANFWARLNASTRESEYVDYFVAKSGCWRGGWRASLCPRC
jgi:hypothetical protein